MGYRGYAAIHPPPPIPVILTALVDWSSENGGVKRGGRSGFNLGVRELPQTYMKHESCPLS